MKLVKLSLAASLAVGAFTQLQAIPLEDAIKNIETSGMIRYRYDVDRIHLNGDIDKTIGGSAQNKGMRDGYNASRDQSHNYKALFDFKAALDDNFKVYVQLEYLSSDAGFYTNAGTPADITGQLAVKQMYFEYDNAEFNTRIRMGKQEMDTIWTDDAVTSGVKLFNNSINGITLAAFWFDDYSYDDMLFFEPSATEKISKALVHGSTWGGAILADFNPFAVQLWGAYNNDLASLYAIDASAHTNFGDLNLGVHAQYLGNVLQGGAKNQSYLGLTDGGYTLGDSLLGGGVNAANGNYYAGKVYGDWIGIDFSAGYYQYGKKDKFTMTTIEDCGELIYGGESLIYSTGSLLRGGIGLNKYFFGTLGYTYDKFRIGVDYVGGTTDRVVGDGSTNSIDKNEVVGRLSYAYSPKLEFSSFYSWYQEQGIKPMHSLAGMNDKSFDSEGKFVRFQVLYQW